MSALGQCRFNSGRFLSQQHFKLTATRERVGGLLTMIMMMMMMMMMMMGRREDDDDDEG